MSDNIPKDAETDFDKDEAEGKHFFKDIEADAENLGHEIVDEVKHIEQELMHPGEPAGPQNPPKAAVISGPTTEPAEESAQGDAPGPAPVQEFPVAPASPPVSDEIDHTVSEPGTAPSVTDDGTVGGSESTEAVDPDTEGSSAPVENTGFGVNTQSGASS